MISKYNTILGILVGACLAVSAFAQQPVASVEITKVEVLVGTVVGAEVTSGGTGYNSAPTVEFEGGGGGNAAGFATISAGVSRIVLASGGSGYSTPPSVLISGGGGTGATAVATVNGDNVTAVTITNPGTGYTAPPTVTFSGGDGIGAAATAEISGSVTSVTITNPGAGYKNFPTIKFSGGGGSGAAANALMALDRYDTPFQNEAYGETGSTIIVTALAVGTFPANGYVYELFVDGISVGVLTPNPPNGTPAELAWTPPHPGAYFLTVKATGNTPTVTSLPVRYFATGTEIINPVNNTLVPKGSSMVVQAVATGAPRRGPDQTDAFVKRIDFYVDGVLFASDDTYPYSAIYTPAASPLTHVLEAKAYDSDDQLIPATIVNSVNLGQKTLNMVTPIGTPPAVQITAPLNGSNIPVPTDGAPDITVTVSAGSSEAAISKVELYIDGVLYQTDTAFPFSFTWRPTIVNDYQLVALAYDDKGNVVASNGGVPVVVEIVGDGGGGGTPIGNPPTISISAPAPNTQLPVNLPTTITASAADSDGSVKSVEFLVNGTSLGTTTQYPYGISWTPTSLGNYTVTAKATDNSGNTTTSSAVTVAVIDPSPTAPSVQITSPANGAVLTVGNAVTIQVNASDDVEVKSVEFFVNGVLRGSDALQPYSLSWMPASAGSYTIVARAVDNVGNQTTSAPVTVIVSGGSAPTVSLTSPAANISITAGNIVTLAAIAADADGTVTSVRFLANGIPVATATSSPYLGTWTPTAAGTYSVVAEATDNAGNITTSTPRTVTVSGNTGPSVTITSPRAGAGVPVSSSTAITASASDPDGTIVSVTFYANNVSIGTDNTPPYSANWSPTAEGTYSLTAVAIDNSGNVVTSPAILVLAGTTGSEAIDTIASGIFIGGFDSGNFTAINVGNTSATFIGYVPATGLGAAKTYYFSDVPVIGSGQFELTNGDGAVVISGRFNDSGVTGTFVDGGTTFTFTGPVAFAQSGNAVRAGYYNGSLTGRLGSVLTGIVGLDGQITIYAKDGSFVDSGAGAIGANGAFSVTTKAGSKFTGTADPATGFLTGTVTKAGGAGSESFTGAISSGGTFSDGALFGLSTRAWVGTGGDILIAGFAVDGSVPKRLLIRGVGPSLGIANTVPNPQLKLYRGPNVIASNDNWGTPVDDGASGAEVAAAIQQAGLGALGSNEAAIVRTLNPGVYTTQLSDTSGATGNGLLEIYDLSTLTPFTAQKMVAISSRGYVGGAGSEMIAGFNVTGTFPKKILIQAVGPGMPGVSGALADPVLRIVKLNGTLVRENDNWDVGNDATMLARVRAAAGATPLAPGSKDAAVLITLPPGIYTAVVSGAGGATGVGLVEVYEVK